MPQRRQKEFIIASLSRSDIREIVGKSAKRLTEADMRDLAHRLADEYYGHCFTQDVLEVWQRHFGRRTRELNGQARFVRRRR